MGTHGLFNKDQELELKHIIVTTHHTVYHNAQNVSHLGKAKHCGIPKVVLQVTNF